MFPDKPENLFHILPDQRLAAGNVDVGFFPDAVEAVISFLQLQKLGNYPFNILRGQRLHISLGAIAMFAAQIAATCNMKLQKQPIVIAAHHISHRSRHNRHSRRNRHSHRNYRNRYSHCQRSLFWLLPQQ